MSLLIQAQTSDDDDEITECLDLVLKSARLGLIHESVDVNYIATYTSAFFCLVMFPFLSQRSLTLWQEAGLHVRQPTQYEYTNLEY